MTDYHIGSLDDAAKVALTETTSEPDPSSEPRATFLQPKVWCKAILSAKKIVSWDTRIFTFQLEHDRQTLGLPIGQHLMVRLRDPVTREAIIRSYTPISEVTDLGFVDMLVKVYFDSESQKGGKMSQAMEALPVGHFIDFKGPIGKFQYHGKGKCSINEIVQHVKSFIMICGGSGITPIYQVFRAIMRDAEDATKCVILNGNRLYEDILCKEELDALAQDNEQRCKILYTLTRASEDWKGLRGRISSELVQEHCVLESDSLVLICGPEAMEKSMHRVLLELGWTDDQLVFF